MTTRDIRTIPASRTIGTLRPRRLKINPKIKRGISEGNLNLELMMTERMTVLNNMTDANKIDAPSLNK